MASASNVLIVLPLLVLAISLNVQAGFDQILCENLGVDECAFAVSSNGQRCIMEKAVKRNGMTKQLCRGSFIYASDNLRNWIESEHCIRSCGLDRNTFGISSDSLMQSRAVQSLCSPACMHACPNIVDLYFNLAAGEGASLIRVCEAQRNGGLRRGLTEFLNANLVEAPSKVAAAKKASRNLVETPLAGFESRFDVEAEVPASSTPAVSRFAEEDTAEVPGAESGFAFASKGAFDEFEAKAPGEDAEPARGGFASAVKLAVDALAAGALADDGADAPEAEESGFAFPGKFADAKKTEALVNNIDLAATFSGEADEAPGPDSE